MTEGHVIYYPEAPDFFFFRSVLMQVLRISEVVREEFGKYADRLTFKGELAKPIYEHFIDKKYNLNASIRFQESVDSEIVLDCEKKVKVAKSGVLKEIGFEYTIEKEVQPEVIITIVKLF